MNRSPGFHHISNATLQLRVHWRLRRDPGHIQSSPSITRERAATCPLRRASSTLRHSAASTEGPVTQSDDHPLLFQPSFG